MRTGLGKLVRRKLLATYPDCSEIDSYLLLNIHPLVLSAVDRGEVILGRRTYSVRRLSSSEIRDFHSQLFVTTVEWNEHVPRLRLRDVCLACGSFLSSEAELLEATMNVVTVTNTGRAMLFAWWQSYTHLLQLKS